MNASSVCEGYMFYNRNYNYNLSGENTLLKLVVDESAKFYRVYQQFFLRFDRTTLKFVFTFPDRCKCFCGKEFDSYFEKVEHTKNEPNCNFVCYCPLCKENIVQKIPNNDKLIKSGFEGSPLNTLHIHLFFFHDLKNFNLVDLCLKYFHFGIFFHPIVSSKKSPNFRHNLFPYIFSSKFYESRTNRIGILDLTPKTSLDSMVSIFKEDSLCNIALVTGKISNLTILDLDFEIGLTNEETHQIYKLLCDHVPHLHEIFITFSCSGGLRFGFNFDLFLADTTTHICRLKFILGGKEVLASVDIRSSCGIAVEPPSVAQNKHTNVVSSYTVKNFPTRSELAGISANDCLLKMQEIFPAPLSSPQQKRRYASQRHLKTVTSRITAEDLKIVQIAQANNTLLGDIKPIHIVNTLQKWNQKN